MNRSIPPAELFFEWIDTIRTLSGFNGRLLHVRAHTHGQTRHANTQARVKVLAWTLDRFRYAGRGQQQRTSISVSHLRSLAHRCPNDVVATIWNMRQVPANRLPRPSSAKPT